MLRQLADDLWVFDHPLKLSGAEFGTRTTVVRLGDGGLFVHSPGPVATTPTAELEALGPVRCLVAPNKLHYFFVAENLAAFPDAELYLAPGLQQKRAELPAGHELGDEPAALWEADLAQVRTRGSTFMEEVVFFHAASRTLLLTDLAFNFGRPKGLATRIVLGMTGAIEHFGPSRLARLTMRDRKAMRASIDRILEWDFDRVSLTHGDVLESGGREALRGAYAFL